VDMSSSVTTFAPAGQQHDREDADMEDGAGTANGHVESPPIPPSNSNTIAIEVAAVEEDVMDTTPDADTELVLSNGPAELLDATSITPTSPIMNGAGPDEPDGNGEIQPISTSDDAVSRSTC
jgi:hypothetical protein